ncbi:MAG: glutaredoxin family protein [Pseudomonadota bacterium]
MKTSSIATLVLLLCAAGVQAQIYKWTDDKGVVHFSDTPPAPDQKLKVEEKTFSTGGAGAELPYELARAASNAPVTLYTASDCEVCDRGRDLLRARGVPFREKTVKSNEDQARLKEEGSEGQLPLLLVGRNKLIGFEAGAWNNALSDASYPAESRLPPGFRASPAEAAAPARAPAADAGARRAAQDAAAAAETARRQKEARDTPPPKFQF